MGKKAPKAPAAPDPVVTAAAQTQSNKDTAYWNAALNSVNQITPYGNLTYTQSGGDDKTPPTFTATTALSPEQQALYNSQVQQDQQLMDLGGKQISRIQDNANTPFSYDGIADGPTNETIMEQQLRAEEALMSRMNPQFARDEEAMRTRLINQGIAQGSEAYGREMDAFNQMKNDARTQAVLGGQQYGTTAQNNALQRRNQGIQEYATQRNAPLNEYIGFTSGTQIQNPQFQNINYGGAAGTDIAGLVNNRYNADYQNYANKNAARNQNISGLTSLALGAASMGMGSGLFGAGSGSAALHGAIGRSIGANPGIF